MTDKITLTPEAVRATLKIIGGDGHTIWKASALEEILPPEFLAPYIHTHRSDMGGSHKGMIFDENGGVIPELEGINGLSLLHGIAGHLGAEGTSKMGRGFQAQELTSNIYKVLDALEEKK